ncbi:MAG: hypothetical protein JST64_07400, partial [Actinobacteria bacterium]|nr:hypothetical protein [Actinomycetota bacterium]
EPLPEQITHAQLGGAVRPGGLVIGLADRPEEQRHVTAEIDLTTSSGLLVLGAVGSGRTTALAAVARSAVADGAVPTVLHAIDGARGLDVIRAVAGPGGRAEVVAHDDDEQVLRLLRSLRTRCRNVGTNAGTSAGGTVGTGGRPRALVLVDGVGAFVEHHDRVNRGEAIELLSSIATDGPAVGVHVVLSARRSAEVPIRLGHALGHRLVLRCASPEEAADLGVDSDLAARDLPAGRGVLDGELVQIVTCSEQALPVAGRSEHDTAGRLPTAIPVRTLADPQGWNAPIGMRADDLSTAWLDLTNHHALVLGPPRSGRSTTLATIAAQLGGPGRGCEVVRLDGHAPDGAVDALSALERSAAGDPGDPNRRWLVVVDDMPELLDGPDGAVLDGLLDRLLRRIRTAPVRIVASGEADAVARCYGDSVRRLRSGRQGILVRPDPDLHPGLLHTVLPLHDEIPAAPGRGWIVTPDGAVAVQVAM